VRTITDHHDGHALAESIHIVADDLDPEAGGASYRYDVVDVAGTVLGAIRFQRGARLAEGSTPGVLDSALLAIVADRMRCFNAGPLAAPENEEVLKHVQEALRWLKIRADERAKRGVLDRPER
jgi:hypothetical protein